MRHFTVAFVRWYRYPKLVSVLVQRPAGLRMVSVLPVETYPFTTSSFVVFSVVPASRLKTERSPFLRPGFQRLVCVSR
jgi:hypothetical protein